MTASDISEASFDRTLYKRSFGIAGDLIENGTPVYKLITSENWSVVFPLSEEDQTAYADRKTLQIKPASTDFSMRGSYSQITGSDGKLYGKVDFDKFMVQFASDRFIDFEIVSDEAAGLKIPAPTMALTVK